ncbi:alpha-L-arabinofuranosidase C-terminal domain-containing protein [Neolewinella lacunae]|uniref:non-reducing end alpha-L-arabinofuranosidase n=1 Tax=Neolewinella lacunae TaxID=1517758 RepID=A0A923PPC8_9BACT|nr:alpha-L-arabinofuranosidase C-terminal domain-containing protein [Neolewinella lacunae]MBC6994237.1 alpha-L-arabinofuranosidase [Neolewinella lacunae]MDN3637145.1 alpha-L-arabinofuranosidase C-terminal domain-containing protein [Neolewinella lacunae]
MKSIFALLPGILLLFTACSVNKLQSQASSNARTLTVDAETSRAAIQPTMYGIFFEDINFAADGGLYAEMVKNRSFEFTLPKTGWLEPNSDRWSMNEGSGIGAVVKEDRSGKKANYLKVIVKGDKYQLLNEGFRGMGVVAGQQYDLTLQAAVQAGNISGITAQIVDGAGKVVGQATLSVSGSAWKTYEAVISVAETVEKAQLKLTFTGKGEIDLDMISLFPQDTWKGRKKGMRKDLVQLLDDLQPGFLRFPGGCIVEGRTLDRRYQWKKTVGPVEDREFLINRWNTEFDHRPTPDYYQSFGLGFFEYFQLSEDMGAEPLPILSCGMACQFNTGELVPMDELGPYIDDALDLIEFANGAVNTEWGKLRSDMGHPEPFNLKYIGVGNEQWGEDYIERYKVFDAAIKSKYPDITVVSGSGPFPDGEMFEYGMEELTKLNAELVDEHYYRSPEWFRQNATRYDDYDRNGPKIFAGEYAAQSVAIASPDNKNNWECALSEAAYMTGMERNADIVVMTSYAPLMAHAEGWQWTPDMIWFNNLSAYGTANYYVQKMYANHPGTDLLSITEAGKALTGQNDLYASAVRNAATNELIIKLVNTGAKAQELSINIKGAKANGTVKTLTMVSDALDAVNSFEEPTKISPVAGQAEVSKGMLNTSLPGYAFVLYTVKLQ